MPLSAAQLTQRRKAVRRDGDINKIVRAAPRSEEPLAFVDIRIDALAAANPSVTDADLIASIKPDLVKIDAAIKDVVQTYDFGHHVNLVHVMKAQPAFRYVHERQGWGGADSATPGARRKQLVRSIIWRAAALHYGNQLHEAANRTKLLTLVDRRLHAVEVMRYHISKAGEIRRWNEESDEEERVANRSWQWAAVGGKPKWTDGHVLRWFEYPRVVNSSAARAAVQNWLEQLRGIDLTQFNAEIALWPVARDASGTYTWSIPKGSWWLTRERTKPANKASSYWSPDPGENYRWLLTPAGLADPVSAVNALLEPTVPCDPTQPYKPANADEGWKNWWERNHFYCDQTLHVLQLKGLALAMQKHHPGANWFRDLLTAKGNGYVQVFYLWDRPGTFLADDPADLYFQNDLFPFDQLQIGDGVVVENHPCYRYLTRDVWGNENALVVDIKGRPTARTVWVLGHGTGAEPFNGFLNTLIRKFEEHVRGAQRLVRNRPAGATTLTYDGIADNLRVRPGLPPTDLASWAVRWEDPRSPSYDGSSGIIQDGTTYYFPLFTKVGAKTRETVVEPQMLDAFKILGSPNTPVWVCRPKVV